MTGKRLPMRGYPLRRISVCFALGLVCVYLLSACGSGNDSDTVEVTATLPAPQAWVEWLPTPTPEPDDATPQPELTETLVSTPSVQAWPTMTDQEYEDYMLSILDDMLERIERKLNNTDTEIRP